MADLEDGVAEDIMEVSALPDSYNGYPTWQSSILSVLAEVNFCQSYSLREQEYNLFCKRTRSSLKLFGTRSDVENTLRLFHFCLDEVERLCYYWSPRASVKRANDFKRGAAVGIADGVRSEHYAVLDEERERAETAGKESTALAHFERKQAAIEEYAADLGLTTIKRRARKVHADAYGAGYEAGKDLDLSGKRGRSLTTSCS